MATLGFTAGSWTRCGCDAAQTSRAVQYVLPLQCSPPRKSVRVVADARKSRMMMKKTKNNAVDVNAASRNSVLHEGEGRISNGNLLESGKEESEEPAVVEEKETSKSVPLQQLLMQKLDQVLDDMVGFMAPREKGDIRDVILMSFSFAVLVYISQRLVCLYCAVRHLSFHSF